jgi:RloB-like protein
LTEASQKGVKVALSRPCFEIWLILHHLNEQDVSTLTEATAVAMKLKETLGEYNKKQLKDLHYPLPKVVEAIQRANQLDSMVEGGQIPKATTTRIYQILESIIRSASAHQLPDEFRAFKETLT